MAVLNALSYVGNAGLGLGSNPDINVGAIDNKVLNDTQRNIMLLDNENNMKMFQQKIKDRDELTARILDNEVSTGDIDPKDQKYFDADKALVEKAYDQWGGNPNDTKGFRKYQQAVETLRDTAAHAQTRWLGLKKQEQELAQETLPNKIKARKAWLQNQQDQPFGSQIVPFQQLHDFSIDDINGGVVPTKTLVPDPNSPFDKEVSVVDYKDILKNKRNDYINDLDKADSINQFTDKLLKYNQPELQKAVNTMDAKIDQYNSQRGFKPGDDGFVDHVKTQTADNGTLVITEPKTDLAAKWALAQQKDYVTSNLKYNKDRATGLYRQAQLGIMQERVKLEAKKVGIEASKANAYVKHMTAATKKLNDDALKEHTDISKMYDDYVSKVDFGISNTPYGKLPDSIYMDELPQGYQYINGAVVDSKGKVTAGKLEPFYSNDKTKSIPDPNDKSKTITVPAGRAYYKPKVVDAKTGEEISSNFWGDKFKEWKDGGYTGTKEEMIKKLLTLKDKDGNNISPVELIIKGQNGTVNYSAMSQAARVMNNLGGAKKGEENIINPPEAGPEASEEPVNQSDVNPENN